MQVLTLRDILVWANSQGQNILSGVAIVLGRSEPNAIFVSDDHATVAERFVATLEGVDTRTAEWETRMALIERISELSPTHLDYASYTLNAIYIYGGDCTPEEEFITTILLLYGKHNH